LSQLSKVFVLPYQSVRSLSLAREIALGHRSGGSQDLDLKTQRKAGALKSLRQTVLLALSNSDRRMSHG